MSADNVFQNGSILSLPKLLFSSFLENDVAQVPPTTLVIVNVIDIHYHVVIYNRVILLSLNNTIEFFNYQ